MPPSLEQIALKVKSVQKRTPVYAEVALWVAELLSATINFSDSAEFQLPELDFAQKDLQNAWSQGRSFLKPEELSLEWKKIHALYRHLVKLVEKRENGLKQSEGLLKAMEEKHNGTPVLIKAALASDYETIDASAKALKVDPPVLALLLHLSLRPALSMIAQAVLERLDVNLWNHGHCPVCGSAPKLADLSGEGGKRRLHCSLCEAAWYYPRMRCPFCENADIKDLSYLRAENEEGLRVDLCSRCNNYLKTIDLREIAGPIIVPLDDVTTWHLDIIAGKKTENKSETLSRAT